MADREKLKRLGDDIMKAGCTAYLWYREKHPPIYGPHLTYEQRKELMKGPLRKKWDALYYRHMGWMYRKPDESLAQYFKRGFRAWLFLGYYTDAQTFRKPLLAWHVLAVLYVLAFPLFPSSAVPGWEYTSPIIQWFGEENAWLVFNLYLL